MLTKVQAGAGPCHGSATIHLSAHSPAPPPHICRRRPDGKWRRQKAGSKTYAFTGWSAFALGNILRFIAMRFAAQTVLSGLGSLQFVIIPIASRYMLGIRASASTILGVTVVLMGARHALTLPPASSIKQMERCLSRHAACGCWHLGQPACYRRSAGLQATP